MRARIEIFRALCGFLHTVHRGTGVFGCVFGFVFFGIIQRHGTAEDQPDGGSERGTVFFCFDPLSAFFRVFFIFKCPAQITPKPRKIVKHSTDTSASIPTVNRITPLISFLYCCPSSSKENFSLRFPTCSRQEFSSLLEQQQYRNEIKGVILFTVGMLALVSVLCLTILRGLGVI